MWYEYLYRVLSIVNYIVLIIVALAPTRRAQAGNPLCRADGAEEVSM